MLAAELPEPMSLQSPPRPVGWKCESESPIEDKNQGQQGCLGQTQLDDDMETEDHFRQASDCEAGWITFRASSVGQAFDLAQRQVGMEAIPWALTDERGHLIAPTRFVEAGTVPCCHKVRSERDLPRGNPVRGFAQVALDDLLFSNIPGSVRKHVLSFQGSAFADDQMMMHALQIIAEGVRGPACVLPPMILLVAVLRAQPSTILDFWQESDEELQTFLSALPVQDHWVVMAWMVTGAVVHASTSHIGGRDSSFVDVAHWLLSKISRKTLGAFRFESGPIRIKEPGMCGPFALADVRAWLRGEPFLQPSSVHEQAALLRKCFLQQLEGRRPAAQGKGRPARGCQRQGCRGHTPDWRSQGSSSSCCHQS